MRPSLQFAIILGTVSSLVLTGLFSGSKKATGKLLGSSPERVNTLSEDYGYDRYVFEVSWSGSICRTKSCKYRGSSSKTAFNLHGLWPD